MDTILETVLKYWVQVACGALVAIVTMLWRRIDKNKKEDEAKQKAMEQALLALLRDRLYQACRYHLSRGFVTTGDLEVLHGLDNCYEAMGGNGTVKKLMQRIAKLDILVDETH